MSRKHAPARRFLRLEALEDRLCLSSLPVATSTTPPSPPAQAHANAAYGQLPLSFEANQGQTDSRVNFLSHGAGYSLFLTPSQAVLSLKHGDATNVVRMRLVGSNPASRSVGLEKQAGVSNYLIGNDPSKWHTNIANYAEAAYRNIYRGINLVYHGDQQQLEYDFVVRPGADPRAIRLAFDGTQGKTIDAQGNLVLHTTGGDVVEHAPVAYQMIHGVRYPVASRFVLKRDGQVGFAVGRYDHGQPLVIDPVMSYSTYLGGNGNDFGNAITVDGAGNAYVTGVTSAANFPTKNPLQSKSGGLQDVFVTKLNATGTGLVYSTYLGGSGQDFGQGIAIDGAGNAYVAGFTASANFPTTSNAFQTAIVTGAGRFDAFLAKLNPNGSALLYSTYLGGSGDDRGLGVAADGAGNAYVTGFTGSTSDFPHTAGAFQATSGGGTDAFVAKLNTSASGAASLVYSTYLGGTGFDTAYGIALDSAGNAYVTGKTRSNDGTQPNDFPIAGQPLQPIGGGGEDAFVTKVNSTGSALVYSTYLGGLGTDVGNAIAVDKATGEAYVLGSTTSADFPVMNAYQSTYSGSGDAFVSRLSATGSSLVYSTYLGGTAWDGGDDINPDGGIAVDTAGNAYVTSFTTSSNFPTKNPLPGQSAYHGTSSHADVFVAKIDTSQSAAASLIFSTYLGGGDDEEGFGIAMDAAGNIYLTGETQSNDFPVTKTAFQRTKSGGIHVTEAFVTKIMIN